MTATDLLARQIERQIDSLFKAVRAFPADKLDWKPSPDSRSALDQLQEIATSVDRFWGGHTERKIEWSPEAFAEWIAQRSQYTDLDELERMTRDGHRRLVEHIRKMDASELELPVQMPFPGAFQVADVLTYYSYNAAYHEGQINYIASLLPKE